MSEKVLLPKWDDPSLRAGTRIRTALWLVTEVGVGNTFTKDQHRQAFSGIAQADRRLRDLRSSGWIIHTSLEDVSLNANEQRLVAVGLNVWDRTTNPTKKEDRPTAKQRMKILASTDYQCSVCGMGAGERYEDESGLTAVLSVVKRQVTHADGTSGAQFVPECKRCHNGDFKRNDDVKQLLEQIQQLDSEDYAAVIRFLNGKGNDLSNVYRRLRMLSINLRKEVRENLSNRLLAKPIK